MSSKSTGRNEGKNCFLISQIRYLIVNTQRSRHKIGNRMATTFAVSSLLTTSPRIDEKSATRTAENSQVLAVFKTAKISLSRLDFAGLAPTLATLVSMVSIANPLSLKFANVQAMQITEV